MKVQELTNYTYQGPNEWDTVDFWVGTIADDQGKTTQVRVMDQDPRDNNPGNVVRSLLDQLRSGELTEDDFARQLLRYDDPAKIDEEHTWTLTSEFTPIKDGVLKAE
ncbi:hypothetical protein [Bifidobacterium magnum]|uniref:Uncharacterized protein n=1 Tax=Bifidobacterium magnum TaxID=1692 RepID=A0A087B990_9BIFI|nr:hypothetical protein [Bifidobacterium magnum]KFI67590.1 hypothetical protein BMAGN_0791 [Bifidobacterium magnum]